MNNDDNVPLSFLATRFLASFVRSRYLYCSSNTWFIVCALKSTTCEQLKANLTQKINLTYAAASYEKLQSKCTRLSLIPSANNLNHGTLYPSSALQQIFSTYNFHRSRMSSVDNNNEENQSIQFRV